MKQDSTDSLLAEYLTVTQAANYLGVSPWTLRNWDSAGKLKPERHPVNGYRIYREEDLKSVLESGHLLGKRKHTLTPNIDWRDIGENEHLVQFYETDAYLVESVAGYLAAGLSAGEAVVILATQEHRRRIGKKLAGRGIDVSAATKQGQYLAFDAARILSMLTRDKSVDPNAYSEVIEGTLLQLRERWPRIRVFGEIVALLWEEGDRAGACALEQMWSDLAKKLSFTLFCAYPISEFGTAADDASFMQICACHTRVLPAESYAALTTPEEQLREISSLQQKAKALEAELAHRKETEKERALLAAIVESSNDAIISKNLDGIITSWNRGAENIFGYTASEAIGQSVMILIPEDRLEEEATILGRIRLGERVEHYETIRRRKDGTSIHVSLTVSPVIDPEGRIIGASKIARDITEHKFAVESLGQSEERYRRLTELLPVGVYTCEAPSGRITYYNEQAVALWGRVPNCENTEERFCGSFQMLVPETGELLPHEQCPMAVTLREGRPFRNFEAVLRRPDGSEITVLVNIDPIRDSRGQVVGAVNVFHDISALKEAQEALREQKENLSTLLETLPVGVLIAHDAGCKRISGNKMAADLLRLPHEANLSKTAPPDELPRHFRVLKDGEPISPDQLPLQRAARGEIGPPVELVQEFDDGSIMHTLVSARPLFDADGRPRGAVGGLLDITDLKNAEQALREADRRKDEFLATLAHELRNPLAPIRTGLELMKYVMDDPESLRETRDIMERQTQQLIALVDDLLDVSRITRGKFELRKSQVKLDEVVRSAAEASQPFIEEAGHTLTLELPERPVFLKADPHRLAQVLSNLLNNAAKFTPHGGRIRLMAACEGKDLVIAVEDNGIGIPPDQLDAIFEMFAQIDRPGETAHTGLGIGLTLVKMLVGMHGGTINAHSDGLKKGTTFTVRLPVLIESAKEGQTTEVPKAEPPNGKHRVLVVDDNNAAADMLGGIVRILGNNEVRTACDGREAIAVAQEFRPDVILMDLGMPRMNGFEAARHIRNEPWGEKVTMVALTGWGQDDDKRRSLEAGFDRHLVKPAEPEDLAQLFAELDRTATVTQ